MSSPGRGQPVDELDQICHQYKQCQLCARRVQGSECIGEFVKYNMEIVKQDRAKVPICYDSPGTCKRLLCECDKQFASALPKANRSYNKDYHIFYSKFNPEKG
jgi:hypothetical protein